MFSSNKVFLLIVLVFLTIIIFIFQRQLLSKQILKTSTSHASTPADVKTFFKPDSNFLLSLFHQSAKFLYADHKKRLSNVNAFEVQVTQDERNQMYDLLRVFDQTLKKNNIDYMICGGTLLGSYRHHDFIPWDDDIDVFVSLKDRPRLAKAYESLKPGYVLYEAGGHDKIFRSDGKKASAFKWLWPYVDVSFYKENSTHIWDITNPYGHVLTYAKTIAFPLHLRPLYNMSLPAPKDTFAALVWNYGLNATCKSFGYSHMVEGGGPHGNQDCSPLGDRFPFVEHLADPKGVREVLRYRGRNLTDIVVPEPSYAVSEMYTLKLKRGFNIPKSLKLP